MKFTSSILLFQPSHQAWLYDQYTTVNPLSANPQNGQTHSNNSSAKCRRILWVCLTIWVCLATERAKQLIGWDADNKYI